MPLWWPFPVALAFLLSAVVTPWVAKLAAKWGVMDAPVSERKIHARPTPLLGGFAIYLAVLVPTLLVLVSTSFFVAGEMDATHFVGFLLGGGILMVGGFLDDKKNLPAKIAIWFPVLAALVAVTFGLGVEKVSSPFGGLVYLAPLASMVLTFLWLLSMTYTAKLLDGLDGLATGVMLVGATMIALLALSQEFYQPDVALLALIFGAALAGFFVWNFSPAHVFLGESGSTFVGFALGVLAVIGGSKVMTTLLVIGVPALDVFVVIVRRLLERKPVYIGDRKHLHHLLFDAGFSQRTILALYMCLAAAFGATSLLFESWQKYVALAVLFLLTTSLVVALGWYHKHKV